MRGTAERGGESAGVSRRHAHRGRKIAALQNGVCARCGLNPLPGSNGNHHGRQQLSGQRLALFKETDVSAALFFAAGPAVPAGARRSGEKFWCHGGKLFPGTAFTRRRKPPVRHAKQMTPSQTHLVIIPSYNAGGKLAETVRQALACWQPVWVVLDGSTDGSAAALAEIGGAETGLRVLSLEQNSGKGAAVLHALLAASREGFTHALVLDADGQHSAADIARFMS